jgi:LysM repeat protein
MYTSARGKELDFLKSPDAVYKAAVAGELKLISITDDLDLGHVTFPFVLPSTLRFADSLAKAYHAGCGERLVVTSGTRPLDEQPSNASPLSVHPTGMAIDFRKASDACRAWMRTNLLALEDRHVIEATEEMHPPHFHVAVLRQGTELHPSAVLAAQSAPASTGATKTASAAGEVASGSDTYVVQRGDNLWTIARRHNTTTFRLQSINHLESSELKPGQVLKLR